MDCSNETAYVFEYCKKLVNRSVKLNIYKTNDTEYRKLMKGCFHCSSGEVIGIDHVCDGNEDCKDGSDETSHGGETKFDGCFAIRGINRSTVYAKY